MAQLSQVLSRLPASVELHMSTMGHVVWLCWHGTLEPAVPQILTTYGGMFVVGDDAQAVWFFFTDDVFLALARLSVWGNFHELPVGVELFPGRLQFGRKGESNLQLEATLQAQQLVVPDSLEVWIHPKSREDKKGLPGISFERRRGRQGMASVDWASLQVDVRMPYTSTQAWFAIIHPLGSPLDKDFQDGWDAVFRRLDALLQKLKMKSIVSDTFLLIAVDSLQMLRSFMRDYLAGLDSGAHWPCVCVVADRNNLNFNADLPKRIGLKWDSLAPEFPYLIYRNAYLLGKGFTVRDLRYSGEQAAIDNWCNVMLDGNSITEKAIPLLMPDRLTTPTDAGVGCVYCGIASHSSAECPTRFAEPADAAVWDELAAMDLDAINAGFRGIEATLTRQGLDGYKELLEGNDEAAAVLRAVMDITALGQLRNVPRHWLYRFRELDEGMEEPVRDESPAWDWLEKLTQTPPADLPVLSKRIAEDVVRHQRDSRLRMVQGFVYMERGDFEHALASFKEAASLTASPAMQAWNEFIQARMAEEQGQFHQALAQYGQVRRVMPQWLDVRYREIVCRVRMGFSEPVMESLTKLIHDEPSYFNRALVDPLLERGRVLVLSTLFDIFEAARHAAEPDRHRIAEMQDRLDEWFPPDHPVQLELGAKMRALVQKANINSYMMSLQIMEERPEMEKELEENIDRQVEDLRNRYKYYLDILQDIRDEASWFPFPGALKEFSAEFNESAGIINRVFACNFRESRAFKSAQAETSHLADLLRSLRKRLKSLRMVRDGTLFGLTFAKTLFWMEVVGLTLCFVAVPIVYFWGDILHLGWLKRLLGSEPWSIEKVLVLIVTVVALGLAALRTTLVFDRKREKLLAEARRQREEAQQTRLERIRRQRQEEAANSRKAKEEEGDAA